MLFMWIYRTVINKIYLNIWKVHIIPCLLIFYISDAFIDDKNACNNTNKNKTFICIIEVWFLPKYLNKFVQLHESKLCISTAFFLVVDLLLCLPTKQQSAQFSNTVRIINMSCVVVCINGGKKMCYICSSISVIKHLIEFFGVKQLCEATHCVYVPNRESDLKSPWVRLCYLLLLNG